MFQLRKKQIIKASKDEIWEFICNPKNLQKITPDYMGFKVLTEELPDVMYPGMMVHYTVKPILGIPLLWVTEITTVKEGEYFVDEQRIGPYKLWHHEHFIKDLGDGTIEMTDIVSYAPPYGVLGRLANSILIKRQLEQIFSYRAKVMTELFA